MNELEPWEPYADLLLSASGITRTRPIVPDLLSAQHAAIAAHVAVEETWQADDERAVLEACERFLDHPTPSVAAAVAVAGATLDTWWVRDTANPHAWDRAIAWSQRATELMPDWVSGWLVLSTGLAYRGDWDRALAAAERTQSLSEPALRNDLDRAIEIVFGRRIGWSSPMAAELMEHVRTRRDDASGGSTHT